MKNPKIFLGISSQEGEILGEFHKCKSCHRCSYFIGYGAHAMVGKCTKFNKDLSSLKNQYAEVAELCSEFIYKSSLIRNIE